MSRTRARSPNSCASDPRVAWVNYAGFPDSPYYALAQKYFDGNASSLFTFGIKGGMEAGKTFYDALKLITRLVNIGDAKSLACHPASTTHRQMSPEQQRAAGVLPETIRLSIGIEHIDDIIEDIDQALAKASARPCARRPRNRPASAHERSCSTRPIASPALAPAASEPRARRPGELDHRLVNNMPDSALKATERQFMRLVQAAAGDDPRPLPLLLAADGGALADRPSDHIDEDYADIAELDRLQIDGLIVTGAEPIAPNLPEEPYLARIHRAHRLGQDQYPLDDLVVPRRARRGAASRWHRTPAPAAEMLGRL